MSKLCNEFVASLLITQRKTNAATDTDRSRTIDLNETVVEVSDDEMDGIEESETTVAKRKAFEENEKKIMEHIIKKKEAKMSIENELKHLKLNEIVDFCISKN